MRRTLDMLATVLLLTAAAAPAAILFPQPPVFGPQTVGIAAAFGILATAGIVFRATPARRRRVLTGATVLLGLTVGATAIHILWVRVIPAEIPTADLLPKLFGLQGEDIDDALIYEEWVEMWLACALLVCAVMLMRAVRRRRRNAASAAAADLWRPAPSRRWNTATVVLWLVGVGVLVAAVVDGRRTADFLDRATRVVGTIADPQDHPRIRFMTADGTAVEFTQNGGVSRPLGASVPVAYLADDTAGTARADTFWAEWSDVLGLLWIGYAFTVPPFFGCRATFRASRW